MKNLYILLLLFISIPLSAQIDLRVSDTNRIVYPANLNVQSISRIGTRALLVFGSTTADPSTSTVVPLLRMQLLEGAELVGAQSNLVDDPATRPAGVMLTAAGTDRFFVAFNDARPDRPGLYLQTIALDGARIGAPQFLSAQISQQYLTPIHGFFGSPAEGYQIVWTDLKPSRGTIYGRRIDPLGRIDGPETRLAEGFFGFPIEIPSLRDLSILIFQFPQDTARLVHADGHVDPRPIPAFRLIWPYFISPDTSIATVDGTSLKIYGNIFETTPSETIPLPTTEGIRPESWAVTRNAATNLLDLYYLRVLDTLAGLRYAVERITLTSSGLSEPVRLLDSTLKPDTFDQMISTRVRLENINRQRPCLQRYAVNGVVVFQTVLPDRINRRFGSAGFGLDESGRFTTSDSISMRSCAPTTGYTLKRAPTDSVSRLLVRFGADSAVVQHMRSRVVVTIPERLPNIFERMDRMLMTWTTSPDSTTLLLEDFDGTLADTPAVVARYEGKGRAVRIPGAEILVSETREKRNDTTYRAKLDLQLATIALWRNAISVEQLGRAPFGFRLDDASFDPNTKETIALISRFDSARVQRTSIYGVDQNGEYLWRIDSLPMTTPPSGEVSLISSGEYRYIIVSGSSATLFDRQNIAGRFSFARSWPDARYQRLLGNRFIRWHVGGSGGDRDLIETEVYSVAGDLLHSQTFATHTQIIGDPFIAENPATSGVAILYAGATTGIRLFYQDSTFDGEFLHAPVSATTGNAISPAGVYVHDTLQAIWEDTRNGEPDIYGTWWTPLRPTGVAASAGFDALSIMVMPNPAFGPVSISLTSRHGGAATLELVDMRGESILRQPITLAPGSTSYRLDLTGVPPGAYGMMVRDAAGMAATRIIVQ
jgi:hypothetical protein